ncbi:MAG TPA: hypothetical protein DIT42_01320, partial [Gammaproteobacteria bacterium]|nr:hypothetical protein [Gammaproteobacteria bacterium]
MSIKKERELTRLESASAELAVAGNGLLSRRLLLGLGLGGAGLSVASRALGADFDIPAWSKQPGPGPSGYGQPSRFVTGIQRDPGRANPLYPGGGASRTPLHQLRGTITPNGLHFERHHAGVPDVDPTQHTLVINGLVA